MYTRSGLMSFVLLALYLGLLGGLTAQPGGRAQTFEPLRSDDSLGVGGPFENSEFIYARIPKHFAAVDTSPGWTLSGEKLLLTGVVYQRDGKTPAPDVLIYYYQTNTEGRYLHKSEAKQSVPPTELGQTHGYIRGWVKTDSHGNYSIYTVRPGAYPTGDSPAHVHVTIKEPNAIPEYYIDDFAFDDDRLLTTATRRKMENRGGCGILRLVQSGDLHIGERNIILGLNIPNYPARKHSGAESGRNIGEDVISFSPFHAWGPDKGSTACPICKYGWYHGILYFVGNNPDWGEIRQWLKLLEAESNKRGNHLKAYFIYGNETAYNKAKRERELQQLGRELQLQKVALTFVPSFSDQHSEVHLNRINPTVDNTFVVYRRSNIIDKYINLKPTQENCDLIVSRLEQTRNEYFYMPRAEHEPN